MTNQDGSFSNGNLQRNQCNVFEAYDDYPIQKHLMSVHAASWSLIYRRENDFIMNITKKCNA